MYVGNLSYSTTDDSLKTTFSQVGEVESAQVITDKMTGRSRGFGFVVMVNDEDGTKAVETFNGQDIDGRKLVVNEARPMTERAPRRDGGGFNRGGGRGFGGGGRDY